MNSTSSHTATCTTRIIQILVLTIQASISGAFPAAVSAESEPRTTLILYSFGTSGYSENENGQQLLSLLGTPVTDEPKSNEDLPPLDLGFWNIAPTGFPPDLETLWSNGILYLTWSATEEAHLLEYAETLTAPLWKAWPSEPEEFGGSYRTVLPLTEPLKFFRLRQIEP